MARVLFVFPFSKIKKNLAGGINTNMLRFAKSLKHLNHDVFILSDYVDKNEQVNEIDGIKIFYLPKFFLYPIGEILRRYFYLPKLVKKIKEKYKIDKVYYLLSFKHFLFFPAVIMKINNSVDVVQFDSCLISHWELKPLVKFIMKLFNRVHVISEPQKRLLSSVVDPKKLIVVENIIDNDFFKGKTKKYKKFSISYFPSPDDVPFKAVKEGVFESLKNVDIFVFGNKFKPHIEHLDNNTRIIYTGFIDKQKLIHVLSKTHVGMIMMRRNAEQTITRTLEFLATGNFIVGFYSKGVEIIAREGKEGFYCKHRDYGHVVKKINKLMNVKLDHKIPVSRALLYDEINMSKKMMKLMFSQK